MEQDLIPTSSSPPSDHDQDLDLDHEPDFLPVGSPELAESNFPQPSDLHQTAVLSDDLRNKIIKQVEYYFCDENLPNDKFLMKYVTKNAEGFVPIGVIASLRKMKKLTRDILLIVTALRESEHLDSVGVSSLDWGESSGAVEYILSSSGEDSDGEIILQPITDVDLPTSREKFLPSDDSITVTAHRLAMLGRAEKKNKTVYGILNNVGLITFSTLLLFLVDQRAWRIVRLPLAPFYLMRPFMISAVVVSCIGYICVPLFRILKLRSMRRNEAPIQRSSKKGTPTMGGLYFVPIGALVAEVIVGFSSAEISGAVAATLAFAAIGLVDDFLSLKNKNSGLSGWMRILLEVAVGTWFSCWLYTTNVSSPYSMKTVVPLPAPLGLVCLGKFYPLLTSFCFVSMANGINLTDGLDGLAGGIAALTFIGMSIAVLPICSDVAIFGASMAGACVGFLLHNRYKASIFMGDTGALALGAALAAMASCTGMFFPLFISSGIFVLEVLSVIIQVCIFRTTKYFQKTGFRFFRMAPFHHHLELCGIKEPKIVAAAYVVTGVLILCGAYVGLISA